MGEPLEALHLVEIALNAQPDERAALEVKRDASALLLERSGGQNLSETMWLRSEIAECEAAAEMTEQIAGLGPSPLRSAELQFIR